MGGAMFKKLIFPLMLLCLSLALLLAQRPATADLVAVTPLPPVTDPDGRLGVCYGFYEDETAPGSGQRPYLDLMYDAGARHDRWDFSWWAIQPDNQSQWNWSGHEALVQLENDKGIEVLGILQWTPQWASTYRGPTDWRRDLSTLESAGARFYAHTHGPLSRGPAPFNSFPPRNLDRPVFVNGEINPDNYWGYFVYHVAQHFDDAPSRWVNAWEIWNEVEGAYFWSGSADDYCQLLQVAYKAIKGEDGAAGGNPGASVLFAGLHYWANPAMYTQVLDCLAAADPGGAQHNYFFDVMSVHFYSRSDNTYDMINLIRGEMAARNMDDHPIWLTETGAPIYGDDWPGVPNLPPGDNYLNIEQEAAYTLQSYANALAAGVERYYFFRAHDADMGEPFGLIRNDKSLRPAYVAYQVAAQYLRGENQATRVTTPEGDATRVSLWGTPRGKVSVLWNRTPDPVTYTLEAAMPTATLVDRWGATQALGAVDGHYELALPLATAYLPSAPSDYIVGGDPLILIETDTVSPTSALAPLPPLNPGTTISLTWSADDADSGVWYTELQASTSPTGPWTTFATRTETQGLTQTVYLDGVHDVTYYFRARARDRVGNWELWPESFEVSTTVDAEVLLVWSVGLLFNDSNHNGVWDQGTGGTGTGSLTLDPEVQLSDVSMRFVDRTWNVVTATIGSSWCFTETWPPGAYTFVAAWRDLDGDKWVRLEPLLIDGTVDPLALAFDELGLWPYHDVYLPLLSSHEN
jgi:hypothetical protein